MRKRLKVVYEEPVIDWEETLLSVLSSKKGHWGCLNKKGEFFTTKTFDTVQVPSAIVNNLISARKIVLMDSGFFTLVPVRVRRRLA